MMLFFLQDKNSGVSMGILEAWQSNFTGKGVNIAVIDNGVEHTHMDLKDRYVSIKATFIFKYKSSILLVFLY